MDLGFKAEPPWADQAAMAPRNTESGATPALNVRDLQVATKSSVGRFFRENLGRERSFTMAAVDLRSLLLARKSAGLRAWKAMAQVILPYGRGMALVLRHGRRRVPPARDALHRQLFHWARELGRRVYFLAPDGLMAHDTAQRAARRFPGLKIAGADATSSWVRGPLGMQGLSEALRIARAEVVVAWADSAEEAARLFELRRATSAVSFVLVMGGLPSLLAERMTWEPRAVKRIRRRTEPSTVVSATRAPVVSAGRIAH